MARKIRTEDIENLVKANITDFSEADYATAAQGATADTAVQPAAIANLVTGPASATDNAIARFDGTTGKLLKDSSTMTYNNTDLKLISANSVDGTKRINLSSYERAVSPTHYGELIRADWNSFDAKTAFAFRDNATNPGTPVSKGWLLAHDYLLYTNASYTKSFVDANVNTTTDRITVTAHGFTSVDQVKLWSTATLPTGIVHLQRYYAKVIDANTLELYRDSGLTLLINITTATGGGTHYIANVTLGNNPHKHMSLEVSDSTGALQSRLEFPYDKDQTWIRTIDADLVVTGAKKLQMVGENASNKDITFGLDESEVYTRWALRQNNTTESGSNAGSDFSVIRYSDAGAALDAPLTIARSSGLITTSGSVEVNGQNIEVDSPSTASFIIDRNATSNFASNIWRTNGTDQWTAGLRNDATNNLYIRDNINGVNIIQAAQGATPAVTTNGNWTFAGTPVFPSTFTIGANSFIRSGAHNLTLTTTGTTGVTLPTTGTLAISSGAQTFTGVQTMTSPSTTTSITSVSTSFSAWNTTVTTMNFAGAATTLTIGGTPTTAITHNYSTNATATATTKTVNLGTGGAAGSTSNINIGSANGGTTNIASPTLQNNGVVVPTISSTNTITNKRPQPRTSSTTTDANLTPDLSVANVFFRTTQTATLAINAPTGTPVIGETIAIYVDSVGAQTVNFNATFIPFGAAFPATTTAGKTMMITAQFNGTNWKTLVSSAV